MQKVLGHLEWRQMNALLKNKIWEIVDLLQENKSVGCVFAIKYKSDGGIERYKIR